ncbi:MAG: aspartate dehydrogenase [Candidatus Ancaeobacter aquaticus]|nr:aspartate dehydrogenase [Candidatus Ancaeobacter aquaticus]
MIKNIGIIGCGNIGSGVARYIEDKLTGKACLKALCDTEKDRIDKLTHSLKLNPLILLQDKLIDECDIIIEAAHMAVVRDILHQVISRKKTLILVSSGGILGNEDLIDMAEHSGAQIHVVSGAIAGLDALKAAKIGGIDSVEIITRKPPKGLLGAPYLIEQGINLDSLEQETVIFSGTATEAIKGFPKNVNVACTLGYAGIGLDKTDVTIISGPHITTNSHEVIIKGSCGEIRTITDNLPSPENPKTSYLAVLSVMAKLEDIVSTCHIGS